MAKRSETPRTAKKHLPVLPPVRKQVPCLTCALCCTYVAVEVSAPTTVRVATEILWYLYHERVSIYRSSDDEWFVQFETRCRNLMPDNKCGIYETRPQICREHSEVTCEVNADDEGDAFFTVEAFLAYLEKRSRRIHALVMKSHAPKPSSKKTLMKTPFERRFAELRAMGTT